MKSIKQIGFIGCGNMGGALVRCALKAVDSCIVTISDADNAKATVLKEEYGVTVGTNDAIVKGCDMIFLGVKPQAFPELLKEIRGAIEARADKPVIVSMAAGIDIKSIRDILGDLPVIRIMPNLPVAVGEGMTLYCYEDVSCDIIADFLDIMEYSGECLEITEQQINAGTALSGGTPGFVCLFIEALADGGVACGIPRDKAYKMAIQSLLGTAALLKETGKHPGVLKDEVCSPGGTTIQGIRVLEEGGLRGTVMDCVIKAYDKALNLMIKVKS